MRHGVFMSRVHSIHFRVNAAELAELNERVKVSGFRRGPYVRRAALGTLPAVIPPINRQAWSELARVGANLNQLAHAANVDAEALDLDGLRQVLAGVRAALLGVRFDDEDEGASDEGDE